MTASASLRALRVAAAVELISLAILLLNLSTVHWSSVSSLLGPTHGCAYLLVIILALRQPRANAKIRVTALVPAIGGLLVLRQLSKTET